MTSVTVLMPNEYHREVIKVTPNAPMLKVNLTAPQNIVEGFSFPLRSALTITAAGVARGSSTVLTHRVYRV